MVTAATLIALTLKSNHGQRTLAIGGHGDALGASSEGWGAGHPLEQSDLGRHCSCQRDGRCRCLQCNLYVNGTGFQRRSGLSQPPCQFDGESNPAPRIARQCLSGRSRTFEKGVLPNEANKSFVMNV